MIEGHQLYEAAIKGIGAKQVADALGVGVQHIYKLAADPMSLDVPVRDDWMRIQTLLGKLAAHPNGRTALILWCIALIDVASALRDREVMTSLTCAELPARIGSLCGEFGPLVAALQPGFLPDHIADKGVRLIAETERLIRCAERTDDADVKRFPTMPKLDRGFTPQAS